MFQYGRLKQFLRNKEHNCLFEKKKKKKIAVSEVFLVSFSFQILWRFVSHLHLHEGNIRGLGSLKITINCLISAGTNHCKVWKYNCSGLPYLVNQWKY